MQAQGDATGSDPAAAVGHGGAPQLYLAQCPLVGLLAPLLQDVPTPAALEDATLSSVNLWVAAGATLSSAHFDPHHNLLCVITGSKRVRLWPPSCSRHFAPHSPLGESPNHSSIRDIESSAALPSATAQARNEGRYFAAALQPGDALFIPAGWWHLVASSARTVGVNYWFEASGLDNPRAVSTHMALFVERRSMRASAEELVEAAVQRVSTWCAAQLSPTLAAAGGERCSASGLQGGRNASRKGGQVARAQRAPPAASSGRASTSGASRAEQPHRSDNSHEPPAAARLAAARQLLCSHWDRVSTDTQSAFAIGKPASSDKVASKRCAVAADCCALALCGCAVDAVQVLSSLALAQPERMQRWLLSGMSPLATEVLTKLLEGWQVDAACVVGAVDNATACAQAWVSLPNALRPDFMCDVPGAEPDSSSSADLAGTDLGQMDAALAKLFEDVYSLVDAHELAQALAGRKQALRECAWDFIRACGDSA